MTEILKFIRDNLERELKAGQTVPDALQAVELNVRHTFAGERPYIAAFPKQRRAVQVAKLERHTQRQIAVTTGLSVRHIRRLRTGK